MEHQLIKHCLCCGSSRLRLILDLGSQPPANSYYDCQLNNIIKIPLGINVCEDCWHAQLITCADRVSIFQDYLYASGTSKTLSEYFNWFAVALKKSIPITGRVLEIAANDGSLMKVLLDLNIDITGIDPAENLVESANGKGIPIIQGFWPQASNNLQGNFDAIICMNVLAHVDNPGEFIAECCNRLKRGGFILIQPSQARMFENMEFDTCYHEHLSFFNTSSISFLAKKNNLKLYGSFLVKIHGDSPVYILGHPDHPPSIDEIKKSFSIGKFAINEDHANYEKNIGLFTWETYKKFNESATSVLLKLRKVIDTYSDQGYCIAFVGAAAKAMTVIHAAGVKPDFFFDESFLKIGKYPPGMDIKISPLEMCADLNEKTLFILTAWNFKDELIKKISTFSPPRGSKFYTYFPNEEFQDI